MGKINVLSIAVANLIAAGEVVDRPSSVIKELMENSIDSGAKNISVEIQNGGTTFMRVSDDGCGMEKDELQVAVRRHATSKIKDAEDLEAIMTLGFRGEALAAIAAVSDLRIISHVKGTPMGAVIEVSGGNILGVSDRGAADGTTVIVENLFENVPARRKFLKKDITETTSIYNVVEKIALSHPDISFNFMADGTVRLQTAGNGKLYDTIYALYGREFAKGMIPVKYEYENIRIYGYTGRSDNVKANRNWQTFYINGRLVKSKTIAASLEQAYTSYLPQEKFPVCILFVGINPKSVDVNVHPSKLEVKFSNEKPVFEAVYFAIKTALESNETRPEYIEKKLDDITQNIKSDIADNNYSYNGDAKITSVEKKADIIVNKTEDTIIERSNIGSYSKEDKVEIKSTEENKKFSLSDYLERYEGVVTSADKMKYDDEDYYDDNSKTDADSKGNKVIEPISQMTIEDIEKPQEYRICGEIFKTYILVEKSDMVLMIDKHAAHERLIFERMKKNLRNTEKEIQTMAVPIEIPMTSVECETVKAYMKELSDCGFGCKAGNYLISVYSIPDGININDINDIMTVLVEQLSSNTGSIELTRDIIFEKALYQASCKAAIKAGREYTEENIIWLVDQLMKIPDITFCPHGRPVAIEMKKSTLDRQFKRI